MDASSDPRSVATAPVLQAISRELAVLGAMSLRLQTMFGALHLASDADIGDAQLLDVLSQRLFALAGFTATLAPGVGDSSAAGFGDALAGVTLSDLARRLAGEGGEVAADTGTFECFGDLP